MSALGSGVFANTQRGFWFPLASTIGTGGGGGVTISSFQTASVSSFSVSSINGEAPGGGGSNFPSGLETSLINGLSSLNGNFPSVVATKDHPEPTTGVVTQFGTVTYTGSPTPVELNPQYKSYMRVFLTATQNDGVPDGLYYYSNEGGASLSSFTVESTGSNANVELSWLTIGW